MKAAVLGSGLMGSVIAWDLARAESVDEVVVTDIDPERLRRVKRFVGRKKLSTEVLDVKNGPKLARFLKGFDVVSSALPHGSLHPADVVAVKTGAKLVNIAFEDEQMELNSEARKSGALLIPGCGVAPGLDAILMLEAIRQLGGEADEGHVMVGGLPQKPRPPYGYRLVFSIVGLLREYTDVARVIRAGKLVKVRPFDDVRTVEFPAPVGTCEGFFTDGLASLLYSMKGLKEMDEMTLRWPGHADRMKFLIDGGFLATEPVKVEGNKVSPLAFSRALLDRELSEGDPEDVTVMRVEVKGRAGRITYDLVDYYDRENKVSSMGKTTGFTGSIVTQMVGTGEVKGKGVIPPEVALNGKAVKRLLEELDKRGVKVSKSRSA
jgi:lysine 6-dehydrogenase